MIVNEYLVSLGAVYDSPSFKKAQRGLVKGLGEVANQMDGKFGKALQGFVGNADKLAASFKPLLVVLDLTKESLEAIYDVSSDISNQFVSMQSLFVDREIRDLMAITGVGAIEAQAIQQAQQVTGMSIQELPFATPEQQRMFTEFIETYTESLSELNQSDLDQFNETTQQFQKTIAEAKLELQLTFMKSIIRLAPQLESLFDDVTRGVDSFTNLIEGKGFQRAGQLFISVVEGIVEVLTLPVNALSDIKDFFSTLSAPGDNITNQSISVSNTTTFEGTGPENIGTVGMIIKQGYRTLIDNVKETIR